MPTRALHGQLVPGARLPQSLSACPAAEICYMTDPWAAGLGENLGNAGATALVATLWVVRAHLTPYTPSGQGLPNMTKPGQCCSRTDEDCSCPVGVTGHHPPQCWEQ